MVSGSNVKGLHSDDKTRYRVLSLEPSRHMLVSLLMEADVLPGHYGKVSLDDMQLVGAPVYRLSMIAEAYATKGTSTVNPFIPFLNSYVLTVLWDSCSDQSVHTVAARLHYGGASLNLGDFFMVCHPQPSPLRTVSREGSGCLSVSVKQEHRLSVIR